MSRYRYNYNILPSTVPHYKSAESEDEDNEVNDISYMSGTPTVNRLPSQTLFEELEREENDLNNSLSKSEDFKASEYSLQMMTPRGAFSFTPSNQKYEGYLQSIILFVLNLNPEFCESGFSKKIREALFARSEYAPMPFEDSKVENYWDAKAEEKKSAATTFISSIPKSHRYEICVLNIPKSKTGSAISIMLRHSLTLKKANKIIEGKQRRFTLPAEKAKDLYIGLRIIGVILSITVPNNVAKEPILSKVEEESLLLPMKSNLRIVNPGLKRKSKKNAAIRPITVHDVIRVRGLRGR